MEEGEVCTPNPVREGRRDNHMQPVEGGGNCPHWSPPLTMIISLPPAHSADGSPIFSLFYTFIHGGHLIHNTVLLICIAFFLV